MHGLTDYSTDDAWTDMVTTWYVLVDDADHALLPHHGRLRQRGPAPRFGDRDVITLALIADTFVHGHEEWCLSFIRQSHRDLFPHLVYDTRCNRCRRALVGVMEAVWRIYTPWVIAPDDPVRGGRERTDPRVYVPAAPVLPDGSGCGLWWHAGESARQVVWVPAAPHPHDEPRGRSVNGGASFAP